MWIHSKNLGVSNNYFEHSLPSFHVCLIGRIPIEEYIYSLNRDPQHDGLMNCFLCRIFTPLAKSKIDELRTFWMRCFFQTLLEDYTWPLWVLKRIMIKISVMHVRRIHVGRPSSIFWTVRRWYFFFMRHLQEPNVQLDSFSFRPVSRGFPIYRERKYDWIPRLGTSLVILGWSGPFPILVEGYGEGKEPAQGSPFDINLIINFIAFFNKTGIPEQGCWQYFPIRRAHDPTSNVDGFLTGVHLNYVF